MSNKRMSVGHGVTPLLATPKQRQKARAKVETRTSAPEASWGRVPPEPNMHTKTGLTRFCGFHAMMFDMHDAESLKAYEVLCWSMVSVNPMGTTMLLSPELHTDPDPGKINRRIFVRWADLEFRQPIVSAETGGQA